MLNLNLGNSMQNTLKTKLILVAILTAYAMPQINFGMSHEKLVEKIITSRPKHVKLTGEDIRRILTREGFEVLSGKCSHIIARKSGEPRFVASSHGDAVDPQAIVWLQKYFTSKDTIGAAA